MGFVVDKAELGHVFPMYFGFPCYSFHQWQMYNVHSVSLHPKKPKVNQIFWFVGFFPLCWIYGAVLVILYSGLVFTIIYKGQGVHIYNWVSFLALF
jgi:hypothetical protein